MPLAYAHHPIAAHLIRSLLEESGVPAVVEGEHGAAMVVMISNTSTTILVGESNYQRGLQILADVQSGTPETSRAIPTCPSCGYDMSGLDTGVCPECGQERSGDEVWNRLRTSFAIAPPPRSRSSVQPVGVWLGGGFGVLAVIAFVIALIAGIWQVLVNW